MRKAFNEIKEEALALPAESRAQLAEQLLESLDYTEQKKINSVWADEAEERIQAYKKGKLKPISGEQVFRNMRVRSKL